MTNEVIEAMCSRRSVRAFTDKRVSGEQLDAVLRAAVYAPSGMNRQPVTLAAVQDGQTVALLSKLNAAVLGTQNDPFYGAGTVIAVLADKSAPTYLEDGSLAMGNLLNAAYSLGIDSCWIHRAREVFESAEGKQLLCKWGVQGEPVGIGFCILGFHAGEYPDAKPRREGTVIKII